MKIYKFAVTICSVLFLICMGCNGTINKNSTVSVASLAIGKEYAAYVDTAGKLHILYDDTGATDGIDLEKIYQGLGVDQTCLVAIDEKGKVWAAYPYTADEVEKQLDELYEEAAEEGGNVGTSHRNPALMRNFELLDSVCQIVSQYPYSYLALSEDGTVVNGSGFVYESLCGVAQFAQDENGAIIGLKEDGTMVLHINDVLRQKKFEEWPEKLQSICAGTSFVGLKENGTVIAEDIELNYLINSVENWADIISLAMAADTVVGLKNDGTVVAVCKTGSDKGQCNVEEWKDIVAVNTNGSTTVGIRSDGEWISTK